MDEIDRLTEAERELDGALLSTAFYAGPRLGELRDLPRRNVDFDGAMLRIESGFTEGERSTPKGKRACSTPLVPILAQRLAASGARSSSSLRAREVDAGLEAWVSRRGARSGCGRS